MPRVQTRRSISVSNETYQRLRTWCEANKTAMSAVVERQVNEWLDKPVVKPVGPASAQSAARFVEMRTRRGLAPSPNVTYFGGSRPQTFRDTGGRTHHGVIVSNSGVTNVLSSDAKRALRDARPSEALEATVMRATAIDVGAEPTPTHATPAQVRAIERLLTETRVDPEHERLDVDETVDTLPAELRETAVQLHSQRRPQIGAPPEPPRHREPLIVEVPTALSRIDAQLRPVVSIGPRVGDGLPEPSASFAILDHDGSVRENTPNACAKCRLPAPRLFVTDPRTRDRFHLRCAPRHLADAPMSKTYPTTSKTPQKEPQ